MRKKRLQLNIFLRIAIAILVLLALSVCFLPNGLYARYITSDSTSDGSRVAKFQVSSILEDENSNEILKFEAPCSPNNSEEFKIVVENDSEVVVKCTLTVSTSENLPYLIKIDSNEVEELSEDIEIEGYHTYTVSLKWLSDDSNEDFFYQNRLEQVTITVACEQID